MWYNTSNDNGSPTKSYHKGTKQRVIIRLVVCQNVKRQFRNQTVFLELARLYSVVFSQQEK